jgi:hypothetical protein
MNLAVAVLDLRASLMRMCVSLLYLIVCSGVMQMVCWVAFLAIAALPAMGTGIEELDSMWSTALHAKAHLSNVTCSNNQPDCTAKFTTIADKDAQCLVVCTLRGTGCRVCCAKGYIYVDPEDEYPLGSCKTAPPPPLYVFPVLKVLIAFIADE